MTSDRLAQIEALLAGPDSRWDKQALAELLDEVRRVREALEGWRGHHMRDCPANTTSTFNPQMREKELESCNCPAKLTREVLER